jgi:hypothetical protein
MMRHRSGSPSARAQLDRQDLDAGEEGRWCDRRLLDQHSLIATLRQVGGDLDGDRVKVGVAGVYSSRAIWARWSTSSAATWVSQLHRQRAVLPMAAGALPS